MIIACVISCIAGAIVMMCSVVVVIQKDKKPWNKVHFYIAKQSGYHKYYLYLGKPRRIFSNGKFMFKSARNGRFITDNIVDYNLNPSNFYYMKEGDIKEVFLNLKD